MKNLVKIGVLASVFTFVVAADAQTTVYWQDILTKESFMHDIGSDFTISEKMYVADIHNKVTISVPTWMAGKFCYVDAVSNYSRVISCGDRSNRTATVVTCNGTNTEHVSVLFIHQRVWNGWRTFMIGTGCVKK